MAPVSEVSLANGRRADVAAVAASGEIWIVEIKSSVEDFRTDQKWPEYRDYCDRLFFAVYNESTGTELWTSRGDAASTRLVADLRPGAPGAGSPRRSDRR